VLGAAGGLLGIAQTAVDAAAQAGLKRQLSVNPDGSFTAFITDLSSFKVTLNALASAGRAKVLASPQILTADNREASIHIGTQIPVLTSQANIAGINNANGSTALLNNVQYRDTGVILSVLPQVNAEGLVNLQVRQEVSDIGAASFGATGSPSFISRQTETTAVVQNGDTLMIGGIIQESTQRNRSGVPYVMDIPVIGRLFRFDTDTITRTELMVLLTPHVVRNREEGLQLTDEYRARLKDVVHEIERTRGLHKPTPEELYEIRRLRSRATSAERPHLGQLPNRDMEE